jgi:hypothetical protein
VLRGRGVLSSASKVGVDCRSADDSGRYRTISISETT